MSCKRLCGEQAEAAQPIAWRRVGNRQVLAGPAMLTAPQQGAVYHTRQVELLHAQLAELEAEMAGREQRARQEGALQGETAAMDKLAPRIEQMMGRAAAGVRDLVGVQQQMRRHMEEDLVKLATMIARRILHRELTVDPEALLGIARAAMAKVSAREMHKIRVYPTEAPMMEKFLASMHLPQRIEVVPDPGIERGGMLVETSHGQLDASIETQLEEIDRGFADIMRKR